MVLLDNIEIQRTFIDGKTKSDFIDISLNQKKNLLFTISESDYVYLINRSPNYKIEVENTFYHENLILESGEGAEINNNSNPNPVLTYRIKIYSKDDKKPRNFFYKIVNLSAASEDQYNSMVSKIGSFDSSMLFEDDLRYLPSRRIFSKCSLSKSFTYRTILDNFNILIKSLTSILNRPYKSNLKTLYKSDIEGKQSSKSIIRNCRTFGDKFYSVKTIYNSDCENNQYLKYLLEFCQVKLAELNKIALNQKKELINQIHDLDLKNNAKWISIKKTSLENRKIIIDNFHEKSKNLLFLIRKILNSIEFTNIKKSYVRNHGFSSILDYVAVERFLYTPLIENTSFVFARSFSKILSMPIKQTSKLFESYCLVCFDEVISELGFTLNDSLINDNQTIKRTYINSNYEFELFYSYNAVDIENAEEENIFYVSRGITHITPDFCLILKKDNKPIKFLVADSKCRRYQSIVNSFSDPKDNYEHNLRDYLSLRFSTSRDLFSDFITADELWFLLPKNESFIFEGFKKLNIKFKTLKIDATEDEFLNDVGEFFSNYLN